MLITENGDIIETYHSDVLIDGDNYNNTFELELELYKNGKKCDIDEVKNKKISQIVAGDSFAYHFGIKSLSIEDKSGIKIYGNIEEQNKIQDNLTNSMNREVENLDNLSSKQKNQLSKLNLENSSSKNSTFKIKPIH